MRLSRFLAGGVMALGLALPTVALRADDPDEWPEKGPKREGRTLVFPTRGIRWTLPEGSPFHWIEPAPDEATLAGPLVTAEVVEGDSRARVILFSNPGKFPVLLREAVPQKLVETLSKEFSRPDPARTKTEKSVRVGNANWQYARVGGRT